MKIRIMTSLVQKPEFALRIEHLTHLGNQFSKIQMAIIPTLVQVSQIIYYICLGTQEYARLHLVYHSLNMENIYQCVKNFDAACKRGVGTGFGVIFRDHNGNILAKATHKLSQVFMPKLAETVSQMDSTACKGSTVRHIESAI